MMSWSRGQQRVSVSKGTIIREVIPKKFSFLQTLVIPADIYNGMTSLMMLMMTMTMVAIMMMMMVRMTNQAAGALFDP